jgi:hypothetical protein
MVPGKEASMKRLSLIILGAWLILRGLVTLTDFSFHGSSAILAVMAVIAGALLILADWSEKFSAHIADFVLGIWLILAGIVPLFNIHFRGSGAVIEVIGLLSGILIILRKR